MGSRAAPLAQAPAQMAGPKAQISEAPWLWGPGAGAGQRGRMANAFLGLLGLLVEGRGVGGSRASCRGWSPEEVSQGGEGLKGGSAEGAQGQ